MAIVGAESSITMLLGVVTLLAIVACFYFQGKLNDFKRYGYLVTILTECMKKHKPLGFIVDKSGVMIPFVVETDEEHVGLAQNPGKYILLAPDMVDPGARMELYKGPKVLIYALPYFFPQSIQSSAALNQLATKIHKHPRLSSVKNDVKVIELMFNTTGTFQADCRTFMESVLGKVKLPDEYVYAEEEEEETEEIDEEEEEGSSLLRDDDDER